MTFQNIIDWLDLHPYYPLVYFITILVITAITLAVANVRNIETLKYLMSVLVYSVTIPGVLATFLTLYSLLILNTPMLDVSIIVYFFPIIAMIVTLIMLHRKVRMEKIPGFNKLSGLIVMISIAFAIVFVLQRLFFGVLFTAGIIHFIIIFAVVLLLVKWAWARIRK